MKDIEEAVKRLAPMVISDEEAAKRRTQIAQRKIESMSDSIRRTWGVPKRHASATIDRSGQWGVKLSVVEGKMGRGVLVGIVGTRGNGKTQLAVEVMRSVAVAGHTAEYHTAMRVFTRLKATFRKDSEESEQDVLAALRKPKLLVLDEIGKRGESDWEQNQLFSLIDYRYGDMNDTILVANMEPSAFADCIGSSLSSRMTETGGLIVADWPTKR